MQPETRTDIEDHLLGSPGAGRVVAALLVIGIAGAVGFVMVSVVAAIATGAVGAVTAYAVAHDDDWARRARRRSSRRRHVAVAPRWSTRSWSGHAWGARDVRGRAA